MKDASKSVAVVSALLSEEQKDNYVREVKEDYESLRFKVEDGVIESLDKLIKKLEEQQQQSQSGGGSQDNC